MPTYEQFAERHGWKLIAESVPFRSDPARFDDEWNKDAIHFACRIEDATGRELWRGQYSVGSAYPVMWAQRADNPMRLVGDDRANAKALPVAPARETTAAAELRERIREAYKRKAPLQIADVLESLALDWQGLDDARDFEEWADELGFDTDSRKAEAMYRQCLEGAAQARANMGAELFRDLLAVDGEEDEPFEDVQERLRERFAEDVAPAVIEQYGEDDEIALNEAFSDWTDMLCKDGEITEDVYNNVSRSDD